MTESETMAQEEQSSAETENEVPVAARTRAQAGKAGTQTWFTDQPYDDSENYWPSDGCAVTREEAGVSSRRAAVEAACVAAGDDSEYVLSPNLHSLRIQNRVSGGLRDCVLG
jgi:hypothetical protein